jgi:hypothetical protein
MDKKRSQKFEPTPISERLVPAVLAALGLGLIAVMVIIILSVIGLI